MTFWLKFIHILILLPLFEANNGALTRLATISDNRCNSDQKYEKLKIYATTFNANGEFPSSLADLRDWIDFQKSPDLVVVAIQEMIPLKNVWSYINDGICKEREREWTELVLSHLNYKQYSSSAYILVEVQRLHGIFLAIFGKREAKFKHSGQHFGNSISTGAGHILGNKGGVGISIQLECRTICFMNSHLAAHDDKFERRNEDFHRISKMRFKNGLRIMDHDLVIWMGDLNYRLDTRESYENIIEEIDRDRYEYIYYKYDQLYKMQQGKDEEEMEKDGNEHIKGFDGFSQGVPQFKPTYKYEPGTDHWNTKKPEMPAWCDRILYSVKNKNRLQLTQTSYRSVNKPNISDHKPVIGEFEVNLGKQKNLQKYETFNVRA